MCKRGLLLAVLSTAASWAQAPTAPVINPRGVTNYFSQDPAPATVGIGGLIQITGLNLGPAEGATASSTPWPTRLGDVQVLVGGRVVPIYSVSPGAIVAQVPDNTAQGLADVAVRRQSGTSNVARINVLQVAPAVRTADGSGWGAPWTAGQDFTLAATGMGPTNPRIAAGDVPAADAAITVPAAIAAYVGGLRAKVAAVPSSKRPGEFDVAIEVPSNAQAGDLITVIAANRAANATVYQGSGSAAVQFVPFPEGITALTNVTDTGVNGNFLVGVGPRGQDGCYAAVTVNAVDGKAAKLSECLTSVNAALPPIVSAPMADTVAALVGPPAGDAQSGISKKVMVYSSAGFVAADLPAAAATLTAAAVGYNAVLPGTPPRVATIDDRTGEVRVANGGAGAAGGGGAAVPGGAAGVLQNLTVDGLSHLYANVNIAQNRIAVVLGDDAAKPTKARYVMLSNTGDVVFAKDFPSGWLPLLGAPRPPAANQPNVTIAAPRGTFATDAAKRVFYMVARAADNSKHALVLFPFDDAEVKVQPFPDGWYATACTPNLRTFVLDLSRKVAWLASQVHDNEFKQNCPAYGYVTLDLASQALASVPLPAAAQVLATSAGELNDYVYATALDTTRTNTSDTLYVLDGVNAASFTLTVPAGVSGFTDNAIRQVPEINSLIAPATKTLAGDQGLAVFNLDQQTASILPVPDGYVSVTQVDDNGTPCCLATKKIVARALKANGSAIAIYNLITGDVALVANPEGVASIGTLPRAAAAPGGGGGGGVPGGGQGGGQAPGQGAGQGPAAAAQPPLVGANFRANTVWGVAIDGAGRQTGVVVIRVP